MEAATKGSGMLTASGVTGADGKAVKESGADRAADWGQQVAEWIDPSTASADGTFRSGGQSALAQTAGVATSLLATPVAAALDIAGTADSAYNWIKREL
jgi:hypothetical protein